MNNEEKPKPRYRLYCPANYSIRSDEGFDKLEKKWYHSESNVIEHLIRYGTFMKWYQIVDTRNDFKVIKEKAPKLD